MSEIAPIMPKRPTVQRTDAESYWVRTMWNTGSALNNALAVSRADEELAKAMELRQRAEALLEEALLEKAANAKMAAELQMWYEDTVKELQLLGHWPLPYRETLAESEARERLISFED